MGVVVVGLDDLLADLESLPARAADKFPGVVSRGALAIKTDWRRRWSPIVTGHNLPHLAAGIGYDTDRHGTRYSAEIGVSRQNSQSSLAHFPEFGSINNAPHPGGLPALLAEEPRFVQAVADLAEELLRG